MKKYRIEFGFSENFTAVNEWQTIDGLGKIECENAKEAAKEAANTDGLENVLFRVYELTENEFGEMEPINNPEYFDFR